MSAAARSRVSFRLLGRSFMAFVLAPEPPVADWLAELDAWVRRSADFFAGRPILLDLARLPLTQPELTDLLAQLQARNLRVIAVEGVDRSWLAPGMMPLMGGAPSTGVADPADLPANGSLPPETAARPQRSSLLLDAPVRSGQSVVFPWGDVTVTGSIASGAEVVAGGSIHVYGTLRGRAIAGSTGNAGARIFCRRFEAELLVIDGLYKTADEIEPQVRGMAVQARLDGQTMIITALD